MSFALADHGAYTVYAECMGSSQSLLVSHFVQTSLDRQDKLSSGLSAFHLINKGRGGGGCISEIPTGNRHP